MAEFIESTQSGKVINVDYLEDVRLKQVDTSYYITFIYSNGETFDEIYTDSTTAQNRYEEIVEILTTASGPTPEQLVPAHTQSDSGKTLGVDPSGNTEWQTTPRLYYYNGGTPSIDTSNYPGIKVGDLVYCYVASFNSFTGLFVAIAVGSLYVTWQRVNNKVASSIEIKPGTSRDVIIAPSNQYESVFYGLAKASGDVTQSASDETLYPVGTYTDSAKTSILQMLGIISSEEVEF